MKKIIALTDYKGNYGSKHFADPFKSGYDKDLLRKEFNKYSYKITFERLSEVFYKDKIDVNSYYLYTSSEDYGYYYKSFIEDVILSLENAGCVLVPQYRYLRANNNKVFMELMRDQLRDDKFKTIKSHVFGTLEECCRLIDSLNFPVVIKTAEGAGSSGVYKAENRNELFKIIKKLSHSTNLFLDLWEKYRSFKYKGYVEESRYRKKYIVQNMISNLTNDWKIYCYGEKYYAFFRPIFKRNGFRASGGGYDNYFYGHQAKLPAGLLNYVEDFLNNFEVPHASIDVAFDGTNFHIIEFQFLYFGTAGIPYSTGYYTKDEGKWVYIEEKLSQEAVYTESIVKFLKKF